MRKALFLSSAAALFAVLLLPCKVSSQERLAVEGHVIGYQVYRVKSVSFPQMSTVLFRVQRIVEGRENSSYLLIKIWKNPVTVDYADDNFGNKKTMRYDLERQKFCDDKLTRFTGSLKPNKTNSFIQYSESFVLMPDVEIGSLPLKVKLPCYIESKSAQ